MIRLLLKDIRITRLFWLPALAFYAVFILSFSGRPAAYLIAHVFIILILAIVVPIVEYMTRTEHVACALPVRRSEIVGARYLATLAVTLVSLVLFLAYARLVRAVVDIPEFRPSSPPTIQEGLMIFLVTAVTASLFFPFYFKSGMGKGLLGFSIFILAVLMITTTFSMIPEEKPAGTQTLQPSGSGGAMASGFHVFSFLQGFEKALRNPAFLVLAVLVTAAVVYISLRLSIHFYSRRDL
jgi:hypothetical protein